MFLYLLFNTCLYHAVLSQFVTRLKVQELRVSARSKRCRHVLEHFGSQWSIELCVIEVRHSIVLRRHHGGNRRRRLPLLVLWGFGRCTQICSCSLSLPGACLIKIAFILNPLRPTRLVGDAITALLSGVVATSTRLAARAFQLSMMASVTG